MNFFETVQEPVQSGGNYIKAGINEKLVFAGFSIKIDKNGNPMLVRSFYPEGGDPEKTTKNQYESFSQGVRTDNRTKKQVSNYFTWVTSVLHFLNAVTTKAQATTVMFNTLPVPESESEDILVNEAQLQAFVDAINPIVTGKVVRYKFVGEEKESTKEAGKIITVPSLKVAFIPYAEAMTEGCEKPVLATTELRFNPESKWDVKKMIPVAPDVDTFGTSDTSAGF
jgi:hypothetical protein